MGQDFYQKSRKNTCFLLEEVEGAAEGLLAAEAGAAA
jgi:hypothetical protein